MIDWTKPVRQKEDQKPRRVLCTDGRHTDFPIIVEDISGYAWNYMENGQHHKGGPSEYDLENIPEEPKPPLEISLLVNNEDKIEFGLACLNVPKGYRRVKFIEVRE